MKTLKIKKNFAKVNFHWIHTFSQLVGPFDRNPNPLTYWGRILSPPKGILSQNATSIQSRRSYTYFCPIATSPLPDHIFDNIWYHHLPKLSLVFFWYVLFCQSCRVWTAYKTNKRLYKYTTKKLLMQHCYLLVQFEAEREVKAPLCEVNREQDRLKVTWSRLFHWIFHWIHTLSRESTLSIKSSKIVSSGFLIRSILSIMTGLTCI